MLCAMWMRSPFLDREIVVGRTTDNAGADLIREKEKESASVGCGCVCSAVQCRAAQCPAHACLTSLTHTALLRSTTPYAVVGVV